MATHSGGRYTTKSRAAKLRYRTLSGTVEKDAAGVSRKILVYKANSPEVLIGSAISTSGTFSISVVVGSNDRFRLISVGLSGENSEVFEDVCVEVA